MCVCVCVSFQAYTRRRLWSDRDQIWHTHADSPRKGSGQNKNLPRVTQGEFGGVLGGQKLKMWEICQMAGPISTKFGTHVRMDSSGNGHRLKTISSSRPKGGTWGVLGGQKCKSQENLPSGCTDWHQICYTSADSSGNGHRLKTISPSIFQGAFWGVLGGHKMQKSGKSTKRLDRLAPNLVNICRFILEWTYAKNN